MDLGEPQTVGELVLGQRKFKARSAGLAGNLEPNEQLAEQVGHSRHGIAPAKRNGPLTVDRGVDIGAEPIDSCKVSILVRQLDQPVVRGERDDTIRQRHHIMVEMFQGKAVKIGKIAGNVQRGNHARADLHIDRATEPAIDQKDAVPKLLTSVDECRVRLDPPCLGDQASDLTLFLGVDGISLP